MLFGHQVDVLCAFVAERRQDVRVGVMELKAAFFADTLRFVVPLIMSAPHRIKRQLIEAS